MLLFADKHLYYADHIVTALHYFAFLMIYLISLTAVFATLWLGGAGRWMASFPYLTQAVILLQFLYVPPMLRRAFDVSWWRAILSTPLFVFTFVAAHLLYRWVQFVVGFALIAAA